MFFAHFLSSTSILMKIVHRSIQLITEEIDVIQPMHEKVLMKNQV